VLLISCSFFNSLFNLLTFYDYLKVCYFAIFNLLKIGPQLVTQKTGSNIIFNFMYYV